MCVLYLNMYRPSRQPRALSRLSQYTCNICLRSAMLYIPFRNFYCNLITNLIPYFLKELKSEKKNALHVRIPLPLPLLSLFLLFCSPSPLPLLPSYVLDNCPPASIPFQDVHYLFIRLFIYFSFIYSLFSIFIFIF